MQKIIEQLYKGEIYPSEQLDINSKEYKEARKAAYQAHEKFEGKLCQAMKDELDEFLAKHRILWIMMFEICHCDKV